MSGETPVRLAPAPAPRSTPAPTPAPTATRHEVAQPRPQPQPVLAPAPTPEPVNVVPFLARPTCHPKTVRGAADLSSVPPGFYRDDRLKPGQIALTFDDGPNGHTPQILDLLKQYGAKATFFVCGAAITGDNYTIIRRMIDEGHLIGNHTYSHVIGLPSKGATKIEREYRLNQAIIDVALTATSKEDFEAKKKALVAGAPMPTEHAYELVLSRPTGGDPYIHDRWNPALRTQFNRILNDIGTYNIIWNAESDDSNGHLSAADRANPAKMAASIDRWLRPGGLVDRKGAVLLMHDRIPVGAVKIMLEHIKANGQTVVGLDEAMADKYKCGGDS